MQAGRGIDESVTRLEIDGVPAFWCEGPGTFTGALIFRVGRSDETLRTGGITHLVEHLAIYPMGQRDHPFGGLVDDSRTVFHAAGTPEEVAEYLRGVCENLRRLPDDRLSQELRVLRAEENEAAAPHPLWRLRFGPRDYGLVGFPEYGLHWLGIDEIQGWADERFTAGNAALWFSGEPPEGLELGLPEGRRMAPPEPVAIPSLEIPAWEAGGGDGIAVSMLGKRSTSLNACTAMISERLQEHLRRELGLTYAVGSNYWRLTSDAAHVMLLSDSAPGHGGAVRDGLLRILDDYAGDGPSEEAIERHIGLVERYSNDPQAVNGHLDTLTSDLLAGATTPSNAAIKEELRAMTRASAARTIAEAMETAIYLVPSGLGLERERAVRYRATPSKPPVDGEQLTSKESQRGGLSIVLGADGVTHRSGGEETTIRFDECALAAIDHDFALTLIGESGELIWFKYKGEGFTAKVRDAIDANLPPDRILELDPDIAVRHREVMEFAERARVTDNSWALSVLPRVLFQGEQVESMARAKLLDQTGLVVVTSLRLLMVDDAGEKFLVEVPRERIATARAGRRLLSEQLVVTVDGEELSLRGIDPSGRAKELAAALGAPG